MSKFLPRFRLSYPQRRENLFYCWQGKFNLIDSVLHNLTTFQVFAMLWHENAGNEGTDVSVGLYGIGKYGENIYSTIRRMVVVAEKHGHCICV
jgi:hypothetical protein